MCGISSNFVMKGTQKNPQITTNLGEVSPSKDATTGSKVVSGSTGLASHLQMYYQHYAEKGKQRKFL